MEQSTSSQKASDADVAQAFKDLAKGEKTASAMESQLTQLEKKIDELLASVEDAGQQNADPAARMAAGDGSGSGSGSAPGPGGPGGAKDESE